MPAACSFSGKLSTRKASTTMSCVAEAVATSSAPKATKPGATAGLQEPRKTIAAISRICVNNSQRRRRPEKRRKKGKVDRISQWSPKKLPRVGRADEGKQADGGKVDSGFAHPD